MKKICKNITPENVFFALSVLGILVMLALIFRSKGEYLWVMGYGESNFCDFWAHIGRILFNEDVYMTDADAIFPPLAYLFLKLFSTPLGYKVSGGATTAEISKSGYGILVLVMYIAVFVFLFEAAVNYVYKTEKKWKKNLLLFVLLFSYPFWGCAFERGNIAMYAMLFLLIGIGLRNHPNKYVREASLICVAIAAGFKLYPALFGLLWLAEKRYKEALRLVIYGLLAFFVPFAFVGSFSGYVNTFIAYLGKNVYSQTSIWGNCIQIFGDNEGALWLARVLIIMLVALAIASLFADGVNWKTITLLTATQTIIIPESYVYTYVYIAIPLLLFLNEKKGTKRDYLYAVLFALVFTIPPLVNVQSGVLIGIYFSWVVMLVLTGAEELIFLCKVNKKDRISELEN